MCARHNLRGGLWIVELSEGVYELRARSETLKNIDLSHLLTRLGQSVVRDTLSHAHEGDLSTRQGPLPLNDPLFVVAQRLDLKNPHIVTVPIQIYGLLPRLILFLREGSESDDRIDRIEARRGHFELLIRAVVQAEQIEDFEAFATQGRLAAAKLHEARHALQAFAAHLKVASDAAQRIADGALSKAIAAMDLDFNRVSDVIKSGLEQIRADRREITNVDLVVRRVVEGMGDVLTDFHNKEFVTIMYEPTESRLITSIAPMALEQALVNLIDNSIGFLPDEKWAQIVVRAWINPEDRRTPIYVDVSDNGPGMTASQRRRLFEPRATAKKHLGTGLGLYVSRTLLQSVGGDLDLVETRRWGGSTFRIKLPAVLANMEDAKGRNR